MNDYHKITENHYRRRAACNTDTARKVDYSRSAPSRIGAVCRSQQGGQKLADTVALLTDFAIDAEEDPERLILQTESHGIGQGLEEQIVSFIHTYPDISLIVIDTLQKVRKTERNGSMYANDYRDIGALKELADKYGICILLVHHLRKQSSSDPTTKFPAQPALWVWRIRHGLCIVSA